MTRSEACKKYPLPDGELTTYQRAYYVREQALRASAYIDGYRDAQKEFENRECELQRKVSDYSVKNAGLESRLKQKEKESVAVTGKAIACLDSVKAMLEFTDGRTMTHRERDFYSQAMAKYIDNIRDMLKASLEPTPF